MSACIFLYTPTPMLSLIASVASVLLSASLPWYTWSSLQKYTASSLRDTPPSFVTAVGNRGWVLENLLPLLQFCLSIVLAIYTLVLGIAYQDIVILALCGWLCFETCIHVCMVSIVACARAH